MSAPVAADPCLHPPARGPTEGGRRIGVLELLATGTSGGAQEHVYSLLSRLDRSRYEPLAVALSDGAALRRIRSLGVPVAVVGGNDDTGAVEELAGLLAAHAPDVLHMHMFRAEVTGIRAALRLAEQGGARPYLVSTVHSSRRRSAEDRELLRALTPTLDRLIGVSRSIVRKLDDEGRAGPHGPTVELIYNGVDLERYDQQEPCCTLPEEYGFPGATPLVGVVARLEPEKGHATLIEAWPRVLRRLPEARLLVIGEGSRRVALEEQADALGLLGEDCAGDSCVGTRRARPGASVIFTGLRDDVPAVTAALDVAVLPSYREAQGIALLEAMALRRPVIATNVGGIPEVVEDGRTGLLVPPRDAEALAGAIVRLLTDHPLADTLGRAGHDLVRDRFCVQRMVSAIEAIYEEGASVVRSRRVGVGAA